MTRRLLALLAPFSGLLLAGCFGDPGGDPKDPTGGDPNAKPECQLNTKGEKSPGYPFDVVKFRNEVLPAAIAKCATSGCHGAPSTTGGLTIWADAAKDACNFGKSFNQIVAKMDTSDGANSRFHLAAAGDGGHPQILQPTSAEYTLFKGFAEAAAKQLAADGGGTVQPPPGAANPFDAAIFKAQIQPIFDANGCAGSGCHGTGAGGLTIKANATLQADLDANLTAVTKRADLNNPQVSKLYTRATIAHSGSRAVNAGDGQKILDWIKKASENDAPGGGNGCAPNSAFNQSLFTNEIVPILTGIKDYNRADQQGNGIGCSSNACHGSDRGAAGVFVMNRADAPDKQLSNFACFVDLASPATSEILVCPTGAAGCRRDPHPGGEFFNGANDLNYQKVLAFLYGTKADTSPNDFAFFVRKIQPMFDDENAVQDGDLNLTCASSGCHLQTANGPSNGSDFGLIPNAIDLNRLTINFVTTTGFINFVNPSQSSLFLYPTNQIANRANPLATGIPHPGGEDFDVNDQEALDILKWAAGLRPNNQGFITDWLVAGDFGASLVTDQGILNERNVEPKIFDLSGGSFNLGQWDGLFSANNTVDLNQVFPVAATSGRLGYAVAYFINNEATAQDVNLTINSQNAFQVIVDGRIATQADNGGQSNAFFTMPPVGGKPVRVMVKLFQRAQDNTFAFSAQARDENGQLLTDQTGEVVLTLAANGGL